VLLALRRGRGDDCTHVSRSARLRDDTACHCHWPDSKLTIEIVGLTFRVPHLAMSLGASCPTWDGKSGVEIGRASDKITSTSASPTHHSQASKHAHEASVPYSDHVCARCDARLDLSGAGPPPQHEQWRAQTRQRTGLQRVSRFVLVYCAKQHQEILTMVLIVANVADVKRSSVPAKTHATLVRRDNYYATSTSKIRRSSLRESQSELYEWT
jgi:hypothetical protein